jgi:FeS assembly SUF system protein
MMMQDQEGQNAALRGAIIKALRSVHDPEIPVNIYDLGLIYDLRIDDGGGVQVTMTLTSPNCPVAGTLVKMVEDKVRATPGVTASKVELVWEPSWSPDRMTDDGKMLLDMQSGVSFNDLKAKSKMAQISLPPR